MKPAALAGALGLMLIAAAGPALGDSFARAATADRGHESQGTAALVPPWDGARRVPRDQSGLGGVGGDRAVFAPATYPSGRAVPQQIVTLLAPRDPADADALARVLAGRHGLRVQSEAVLLSFGATMVVFGVPDQRSAESIGVDLRQEPGVVESDVDAVETFETLAEPLVSQEYALPLTGVQRAHAVLRGRDVLIGIVDTGIDTSHPDLRGAVAASETLIAGRPEMRSDAHGTAIAGIVAARGIDGGVLGIAPAATLVSIQACAAESPGSLQAECPADRVAQGVDLAVSRGVQILNLSFGGPPNTVVDRIVLEAILVHQVIVVAAAGNNGPHGPPEYPAALPGVVAVAATNNQDMLDGHSNLGSYVSLLAPGVDILTTVPDGRYAFVSGTSYAAAVTSGVLALLIEAEGRSNPSEAIVALRDGADPIQVPGRRLGRVNVCRALSILGHGDICAALPRSRVRRPPGG